MNERQRTMAYHAALAQTIKSIEALRAALIVHADDAKHTGYPQSAALVLGIVTQRVLGIHQWLTVD